MNRSIATRQARFALSTLSAAVLLALAAPAFAQSTAPTDGQVIGGQANIGRTGNTTTITQTTNLAIINWQTFNIGVDQTVRFDQPGASSIALNRVIGPDPSVILGTLTSNGQVFLINPNGVLFGKGSSVSVGGLVATTMGISDADFMAGKHHFSNAGPGEVVNQGTLQANGGGYVALMGRSVRNEGVISARLGSVALAGGEAVTLDVAGDGLLNVAVTEGAVNALVQNSGMIQADGGRVLLTAQAAGNLLNTVVNNTGVIRAQTLENREGKILLLADMNTGTVNAGGVLDASAPVAGNGGFIETSAANVRVASDIRVTTAAANGHTGTWLIDPQDFTIGSAPGDNISGATLSAQLVTNNITINTAGAGAGNGDIFVNDAITWSASGAPTTLSLIADRNIEINAAITATNGNFSACCGQDINVNAAITLTNGSLLLSAGRNLNQNAAITVTDGNILMCAANDVFIGGALTLTRGTDDPTRSLGLARGLMIRADTDGTGPGEAGGTLRFDPLAPPVTVTAAPVSIFYNPVSYTTPTDYSTRFTLSEGASLSSYMLVFANVVGRAFDGGTGAILSGLVGNPAGVDLLAGPDAVANYDSPDAGTHRVRYTGYSLTGPNAGLYALAVNCCGPLLASTVGIITTIVAPPPVVVPPPVVPPTTVVTPPPPLVPPPVRPPTFTPTSLVSVTTPPRPDTVLTVQEEEVIETPPYVAPVRAPKPYRN